MKKLFLACLFACCTLMCAAQLRPEDNTVAISYSDILNSGTEGNIVNELAAAISGNITYDIETDQLGVVQGNTRAWRSPRPWYFAELSSLTIRLNCGRSCAGSCKLTSASTPMIRYFAFMLIKVRKIGTNGVTLFLAFRKRYGY